MKATSPELFTPTRNFKPAFKPYLVQTNSSNNMGHSHYDYNSPTESSFLIVLISNSARFSWIPGSEPIHLDLEKLFLLSDAMENLKFY